MPGKERRLRLIFGLLTFAIALGAVLRFTDLDRKFFYGDEVISSLRESGYTESDFAREFDGKVRTVREISLFLSDRSSTPGDTIRSLSAEDPQHPPLFYLATRYWTQALGDTITTRRSLAAVFGTLALLAVLWLGYELFGSFASGAIASALVAVSPFHIVYSQQNREYSAWVFLLALQGALLLRALRTPARSWWFGYAACLTAALYTDTLVLYGVVSFTLFVALRERRWSSVLRDYTAATLFAFLAYAPWLFVLYRGASTITGWMGPLRVAVSPQIYVLKWLFNTAAVFFDLEYEHSKLMPIAVLVLLVVAGSFVAVLRARERGIRLFILTLVLTPALAFIASDWLAHTSRATAPRYLVPVWLGCELAVAYGIGHFLLQQGNRPSRRFAAVTLAFLLACGLAADVANLPQRQTPATAEMGELGPEARAINAARTPLVVYVHDGEHWDIAVEMLATVLRPDVRVQLFDGLRSVRIANADAGFFLYEPSKATQAAVQRMTGGRWAPVTLGDFGSPLVERLRRKSDRDRGVVPRLSAGTYELWQRLPDVVAKNGSHDA